MVRAEIVAIGSELVLGGVADTNSLYLAEELLKLGIEVRYKTVVGDDSKDMEAALQHALGRADVVITTGGDRKSTRLNSSHGYISYADFCLKKKMPTARARSQTRGTSSSDTFP